MLEVGRRLEEGRNMDELYKREERFNSFLQLVYKCPLRGINQKCIKQGYMGIAKKLFVEEGKMLSESFEIVVNIIEHDYKRGFLKYKNYWRSRKFYKELAEKAREFERRYLERTKDREQLLLRFLNTVVSLDQLPEKLNATTIADLMGINLEIAKEFIKWLKKSDYYPFVKFVVDIKRRETALKQHNARK